MSALERARKLLEETIERLRAEGGTKLPTLNALADQAGVSYASILKALPAFEVGALADDLSPYGALGLSSGVREWTDTRAATSEGEASPAQLLACGASCAGVSRVSCQVTTRTALAPEQYLGDVGFRLCIPLAPLAGDTPLLPGMVPPLRSHAILASGVQGFVVWERCLVQAR